MTSSNSPRTPPCLSSPIVKAILVVVLAIVVPAASLLPMKITSARTQDASTSTAAAAPGNAIAYINVPLVESSEQWLTTQTLMARKGLDDDFRTAITEELLDYPLDSLLGGEVALILTYPLLIAAAEESGLEVDATLAPSSVSSPTESNRGPKAQGWAIALKSRAPETASFIFESAAKSEAAKSNLSVESFTVNGVGVLYAPPGPSDDPEVGLAVAKVDDMVLIAGTPADLEPLIETMQGKRASLADYPPFVQARDALPDSVLVYSFVNGAGIRQLSNELGEVNQFIEPTVAFDYLAFTLQADSPGFRLETVSNGYQSRLMDQEAPSLTFAQQVPSDAMILVNGLGMSEMTVLAQLGAMGIYSWQGVDVSEWLLDDISVARQFEDFEGETGLNIQTGLLRELTDEFGVWARVDQNVTDGISALVVAKILDEKTLTETLSQLGFLAEADGFVVGNRRLLNGTMFTISNGSASFMYEYGIVNNELLVGDERAVDLHVRGNASSLAKSRRYREVMNNLPETFTGQIYVDVTRLASFTTPSLREGLPITAPGDCAAYGSRIAAQLAYDDHLPGTYDLDDDADGQACEDYFATRSPNLSQTLVTEPLDWTQLPSLEAFATVWHGAGGMHRTSSLLYIGGE